MNVIKRQTLVEFWLRHRDAEGALRAWFDEVRSSQWENAAELKRCYPMASIVNAERVVFNIRGNRYRLVVCINYCSGTMFVRFIGTHAEYDMIDAETV